MPDQPTLITPRLTLRPFTLADAPDIQRLAGAREVADTTATIPHPYPDGAAEQWIGTHAPAWEARRHVAFAITLTGTGALLGAVSLALSHDNIRAEMGYWIAVGEWGHGYATEAATAVCDFGFSKLGLHRIFAHHFTRNPASGRVMQKVGMQYEGTLRGAVLKDGRFEDTALYAVLAPEWKGPRHRDGGVATRREMKR